MTHEQLYKKYAVYYDKIYQQLDHEKEAEWEIGTGECRYLSVQSKDSY